MLELTTNLSNESIQKIQELVQLNLDSRDGFREAAEHIDDDALAAFCTALAEERGDQAEELQRYVEINGESPRTSGSYSAALHRAWIDIRSYFSSNDIYAVLAEAERGEDYIKQAYEESLRDLGAGPMQEVLSRQFIRVRMAHDRVRDLRDRERSTSDKSSPDQFRG